MSVVGIRTARARRHASVVAAVLVAAAAVTASGCGSSSVSNAIDPVAQAATVSNGAAGFRLNMTMQITSRALPQAITGRGAGAFSPASRTGQLNFTLQLPKAAAAAFGSSGFGFQEVVEGQTVYLKLPAALAARLPGQKPWLKVDLAQVGKAAGLSGLGSLLNNPTSGNPAQLLQYLRATSGRITKVGTAQIQGVSTTQYRASIDLAKYPNLVAPAKRAAARQAIQQLEAMTKLSSIPMNVWIDQQHLVRQLSMSFTEQLPTGAALQLSMAMQLSHYGPQPAPTPPRADQVGDLAAALGQKAGSTGSAP
ncbi:MAG TPA: hypothetical protein VLP43_07265 [Solirubrobacteraceae bacterium]|nr:hypothetical protein [Solirubrobacteraceae bacterium]